MEPRLRGSLFSRAPRAQLEPGVARSQTAPQANDIDPVEKAFQDRWAG